MTHIHTLLAWALRLITEQALANNPAPPANDDDCPAGQVCLIEPLGGESSVEVGPGIETFVNYFNDVLNYTVGVAVGICVLWVLVSGVKIMLSGSNSGMRDEAKDQLKWAIGGLMMLFFAGLILRTLNASFFRTT